MVAETPADVWAAGDAYEPYVGRWSRSVARAFLRWLALPSDLAWLDVGCGTGALSRTILDDGAPRSVLAVDSSAGYLDYARAHVCDPRLSFRIGDAQALPLADRAVDAAASGLVLNFIPDAARALAEMRRVVRPGGTVALYVWDYAGEMQLMRHFWNTVVALDPEAEALDEGRRFPICNPAPLSDLFRNAGLADIEVRTIDVPTVFRDFADYWTPFLGAQGPAPGYCMSLSPARREALRIRLRDALPTQADGRISLIARAFAVRAVVPESPES
ncbi:MAG TPA: methyltransferase domain-containing protein [Alphaproteobacteria bacterium]